MQYRRLAFASSALVLVGCATAGEPGAGVEVDAQDIFPVADARLPVPPDAATPVDARPDAPVTPPPDASLPPPDAGPVGSPVDTCVGVTDVTAAALSPTGVTLTGSTAGFANDVSFDDTCTGFATDGPDAIVAVQMSFFQTLTATATPSGSWDPALAIVAPCGGGAECLAGIDDGLDGEAETTLYISLLPETVYVVVDSYQADVSGSYSLNVRLQ